MLRLEAQIRAAEEQVRAREAEMRAREQQLLAEQGSNGGSFLAALVAAGYGGISVDDIIELHGHGVTPEFLRALGPAGPDKLPTKELIALADSGVRPELFRALREAFPQVYGPRDRGGRPNRAESRGSASSQGIQPQSDVAADHPLEEGRGDLDERPF